MRVAFRTVDGVRVRYADVDAGRFVWEERPDEYAALIADWVTGGYHEAAAHGATAATMSTAHRGRS
jgi:hypothetical protein